MDALALGSEHGRIALIAHVLGYLSYVLLFGTTVWGIVLRNGWAMSRVRHQTMYGAHQTFALLGLCLGGTHVSVHLLSDVATFLTFLTGRIGIAIGTLAILIMLALAFSILVQRRLGYNRWRNLHLLAYLAFTALTAHLVVLGGYLQRPLLLYPVASAWLLVVGLSAATSFRTGRLAEWEVGRHSGQPASRRGKPIIVQVDPGRCAHFGFCVQEAPRTFALQRDGLLTHETRAPVDQVDALTRAAQACPTRAISVTGPHTAAITSGRRRAS